MPLRRGEVAFDAIYQGSTAIIARYVGSQQIWPEGFKGRGSFDFAASANLKIDRKLAGAGAFDFTATGSFDESAISGSGSFGFDGAATLQATRNLASSADFEFEATGALIKIQQVSASGSFEFDGTAEVDSAGFTRGFSIGFRS